jgi:TPR repeat protein
MNISENFENAVAGNAAAQYSLGVAYYNGDGVTQNYAEAIKWFELAANQGDADAQCYLVMPTIRGKGLLKTMLKL